MKTPEHDLQVRCVTYFRYHYPHLRPLFFSVPNGGHRHKATAARLKAEGETTGVADLILLLPNRYYHSLNIEMKWRTRQSPAQKLYEMCCRAAGGRYVICRSLAEFQHELADYLSTVDPNTLSALAAIHRAVEADKAEAAKKEYKKLINNGQLTMDNRQ